MADCQVTIAVCASERNINKVSEMADCDDFVTVCASECNTNKVSEMADSDENVTVSGLKHNINKMILLGSGGAAGVATNINDIKVDMIPSSTRRRQKPKQADTETDLLLSNTSQGRVMIHSTDHAQIIAFYKTGVQVKQDLVNWAHHCRICLTCAVIR